MDWSVLAADAKPFDPYPHQVAVAQRLLSGRSVLVRAPTGSGKTEAICGPFLYSLARGGPLPRRLIYSLPMRVLATTLRDRAARWVQDTAFCQHGEEPETPLFARPLIFATINQSLGSFINCPPTLPRKLSNIAAGAVLSAMLAFDEIQLLDPQRALQAMLVLLSHQRKLGIPFVIATATLPDVLAHWVQEEFGCDAPVEVAENDIPSRRGRCVKVSCAEGSPGLPIGRIRMAMDESSDGNVAVICNTVRRAQAAYEAVKGLSAGREVLLLHSQFLPRRRRELEQRLKSLCGKREDGRGYYRTGAVVVATQVIEAGLDASFDHLFTEAAPVDSVIQRAGRVARGGGDGGVTIYAPADEDGNPAPARPYDQALTDQSTEAFRSVRILDWDSEKRLVNEVLGPHLERYLQPGVRAIVREVMNEAAFEGSQWKAQEALLESRSCRLSIHAEPESLGERMRDLEYVTVPCTTLRGRIADGGLPALERVDVEWRREGDRSEPFVRLERVDRPGEVWADVLYVASPRHVRHDEELGLVFEGVGESFETLQKRTRPTLPSTRRRETWIAHALETARVMREQFIEPERDLWARVADWWGVSLGELEVRLLTIAVLHDLGKLNERWQRAVGWKPAEEPLAHSEEHTADHTPAHATVGSHVLMHVWGPKEALWTTLRLVIQHHHAVGATSTAEGGYRLLRGWREVTESALQALRLPSPDMSHAPDEQRAQLDCKPRQPSFDDRVAYVTYCLACRALRCSDWIATGGDPNAVLGYEDWFRNG